MTAGTRLSVEQYHAMIRTGILTEDDSVELLEGRLIRKQRVYARAGIALYWIINLGQRQIEVYTLPSGPVAEPVYGRREDYSASAEIPVIIGGQQLGTLRVSDLMP